MWKQNSVGRTITTTQRKKKNMNKFWRRNVGFVILAGTMILLAGSIFVSSLIHGWMSRQAGGGTNITYQLPPGGWQSLPPSQPAQQQATQTPATAPLFQGGTVVHHHATAPVPTPVQYSSSFKTDKQDAWSHENGFLVSAPAGGRDAINANSTANVWKAQQAVSEQRSQEAAAKEIPPKIVTKLVSIPVVKKVAVPVYVDRTVYVHPRYWYSPLFSH